MFEPEVPVSCTVHLVTHFVEPAAGLPEDDPSKVGMTYSANKVVFLLTHVCIRRYLSDIFQT